MTTRRKSFVGIAPDGGYGWMIVCAAFITNILVDGIATTYGVLFVEFVDYFQDSKAKTSLVGSLLCCCYFGIGEHLDLFVTVL